MSEYWHRFYDISMWVMEFCVLLLIGYEVWSGIRQKRKNRKRESFLDDRALELSKLMDKGRRVQSIVPDPQVTSDLKLIEQWKASAKAWEQEVNATLAAHSQRASAAFLLVTNAGEMDSLVYGASGRHFVLVGNLRECYQRLVVLLENLGRIVSRPGAYF